MLKRLILIGIAAGGIFGLFLKVIEQFTDKKVYTLLMNVDYFPLLKNWKMSEVVEFSLHLFVSVILVIVLYNGLKFIKKEHKIAPYIWINVIIGGILFLTTVLSARTPELIDMIAFIYWLGGHLVFGALVGILIKISR